MSLLNGLGDLQREPLVKIYEEHLEYAKDTGLDWRYGVGWRSCCATRSEQSAHSRALARLEAYGLIRRLRHDGYQSKRLTNIQIRPTGILIAERLTKKQGVWMLTVGTMSVPELRPMTAEEFREAMARIRELAG